ncbi:MAG: hypothetical protein HRT57_15285, partial [Crocinitomicaceae bacterium]|nr:hypothetical protein [Crocinitomicaceae bacterium]
MKFKNSLKYILVVTACILMAASCIKPPVEAPEFDKADLLDNVATNLIVPALNNFDSKLNTLKTSFDVFEADRTSANLEVVRTNWKAAYSAWQTTKIYDFGPVYDNGFKSATGTFPSDTAEIRDNILNGGYNLASASNVDA